MDIQGFFTKKGLLLAAKLATGSTLTITRACAGAAETALSAAALSQIRQTLSVGAARRNGDTAVLPVTLEAGMAGSAYTLRELGVYAQDPDEGEILYKVYRLSEPVEVRPSSRLVLRFYLEETVSQDLNVTVVRASAGLLTEADLDPVRNKVEAKGVPSRTVNLAATELPGYIAALPRLLTESLTINVSGTLADTLRIERFYGSGDLRIWGAEGCAVRNVVVANCAVTLQLINLGLGAPQLPSGTINIVEIAQSAYVRLRGCAISGGAGLRGLTAIASTVQLGETSIKSCEIAVLASGGAVTVVYAETSGLYADNKIGGYVWSGGIILLGGSVPDLLGGAANTKGGGMIAKANGTLV